MAQRRRRRRRRKLKSKFIVRRAILVILPLFLIGAGIWFFATRGTEPKENTPVAGQPLPDVADSSPSSPQETSSEPDVVEPVNTEPVEAEWNLLLVNGTSPLPDDFNVELETLTDIYQVDVRITDNVRQMINAAREVGIELMICSAYRTIEKQEELFGSRKQSYLDQGMDEEEAVEATLNYTSMPGASEHHTGLAVDIVTPSYQNLDEGYAETPAAQWLVENAADYGFILRYPKNKESITQVSFEPWHYRYVGVEHAKAISEAGYCLEEYIYVAMREQAAASSELDSNDEPIDEPQV